MAKKKTVKQQDFMKRKLKVGKPKQKPSNVTDTSFQMKRISIPSQTKITNGSVHSSSGGKTDLDQEVIKRVTLLRHHSDVTRKETVIYFESMIPRIIRLSSMNNLMQGAIPLICDSSRPVREELVKLLDTIGKHDANVLKLQIRALALYVYNAMTHIIAPIQRDSGNFVHVLLDHCADELVRHAWVKILTGFFQVLGWNMLHGKNKSVSMGIRSSSVMSASKNKKQQNENLKALLQFIQAGLAEDRKLEKEENSQCSTSVSTASCLPYMIPEFPQPYAYLKLFTRQFSGKPKPQAHSQTQTQEEDLSQVSFEDRHARTKVFKEHYYEGIKTQLPALIKDGGECGRTAHLFSHTLEDLMRESEVPNEY